VRLKNEPSDEFAICLTDSGAVIYGTEWCGHCRDQKKCLATVLVRLICGL